MKPKYSPGIVGPDFVVARVDFTIDVTYGGTSQRSAVDCQRMIWNGDRWLIGPGPEPAAAPSMWPGTDAALKAGYRELHQTAKVPGIVAD